MAINSYPVGQLVRNTATFKVGTTLTNPTTVTVRLKNPRGVITTPAATNVSTGIYQVDVTPDLRGQWTVRYEGTGACIAACETRWNAESEVVG